MLRPAGNPLAVKLRVAPSVLVATGVTLIVAPTMLSRSSGPQTVTTGVSTVHLKVSASLAAAALSVAVMVTEYGLLASAPYAMAPETVPVLVLMLRPDGRPE